MTRTSAATALAVELVREGVEPVAAAALADVERSTLYRAIKRAGLPPRPQGKPLLPATLAGMRLYVKGATVAEAAERSGAHTITLAQALHRYGLARRKAPPPRLTSAAFEALAQLLRLLPGASREAARLVLVEGKTLAEAANVTGLVRGSVDGAVRRCRRGLELAMTASGGPG